MALIPVDPCSHTLCRTRCAHMSKTLPLVHHFVCISLGRVVVTTLELSPGETMGRPADSFDMATLLPFALRSRQLRAGLGEVALVALDLAEFVERSSLTSAVADFTRNKIG